MLHNMMFSLHSTPGSKPDPEGPNWPLKRSSECSKTSITTVHYYISFFVVSLLELEARATSISSLLKKANAERSNPPGNGHNHSFRFLNEIRTVLCASITLLYHHNPNTGCKRRQTEEVVSLERSSVSDDAIGRIGGMEACAVRLEV